MAMSLGRWLLLIVLFGVAVWAIRRAGRDLRAQVGRKSAGAGTTLTPEEVKLIVSRGLATPETLFKMTPAEQRMLAAAVATGGSRGVAADRNVPE